MYRPAQWTDLYVFQDTIDPQDEADAKALENDKGCAPCQHWCLLLTVVRC